MRLNKDNITFKIILLGDSSVGKSSLILRYTDDLFPESNLSTIGIIAFNKGIDLKKKIITLENNPYVIQIWDTAGQERFRNSIPRDFYKNSHGVLLLYDTTNPTSFKNIKIWIEILREHAEMNSPIFLIGNKVDLVDKRKVSINDGEVLSFEYNMNFFETSARNKINVDEVFSQLIDKIYLNYKNNRRYSDEYNNKTMFSVRLNEAKIKCCK